MSRPGDNRIEDDPNASLRALEYVADQLEAQALERDAIDALELHKMIVRERIRTLRHSIAPALVVP